MTFFNSIRNNKYSFLFIYNQYIYNYIIIYIYIYSIYYINNIFVNQWIFIEKFQQMLLNNENYINNYCKHFYIFFWIILWFSYSTQIEYRFYIIFSSSTQYHLGEPMLIIILTNNWNFFTDEVNNSIILFHKNW